MYESCISNLKAAYLSRSYVCVWITAKNAFSTTYLYVAGGLKPRRFNNDGILAQCGRSLRVGQEKMNYWNLFKHNKSQSRANMLKLKL